MIRNIILLLFVVSILVSNCTKKGTGGDDSDDLNLLEQTTPVAVLNNLEYIYKEVGKENYTDKVQECTQKCPDSHQE